MKLKKIFLTSFFILFSIICSHAVSNADTTVSGVIASSTTWAAAKSPYILTGSIIVNTGATLTIEPGVTVKLDAAKAIQVDGKIVARGNAGSRITFTSSASVANKGDWGYIQVTSSGVKTSFDGSGNYLDGSILEYCTIEYGGGSGASGMLWADTAGLYVNYCTIQNSGVAGLQSQTSGNLMVSNCEIKNNSGDGISAVDAVIIKNNTVSSNTSTGVSCSGNNVDISNNTVTGNNGNGGMSCSGKNVNISKNTITGNTGGAYGGIYLSASGDGTSTITGNTITGNSGYYGGGINATGVTLIASNTISGNNSSWIGGGGISCGTVTTLISGNTINTNVTADYGGGFYGTGSIANNCFSNNSSGTQHGNALYITDSNAKVNNNNILQTSVTGDALDYALAKGSPNLDATNNYWGTTDDASVQAMIYDFFDDGSKAVVNYKPFRTSEASCVYTATSTTTTTTVTTTTSTDSSSTTTTASTSSSTTTTVTTTTIPPTTTIETTTTTTIHPTTTTTVPVTTTTVPPGGPLKADFTGCEAKDTAPAYIQFYDTSTGNPVAWEWTFGDGGASYEQNPLHTYSAKGKYTVMLKVTDNTGATDTEIKANCVMVGNCAVDANFKASPTSGTDKLTVQFTDLSTGPVTAWQWSFGDGGSSEDKNPVHDYNAPGVYTVSLIAEGGGCRVTDIQANLITVNKGTGGNPCGILQSVQGRAGAEEQAAILRNFRDNRLAGNFKGGLLIGLYYFNSDEIVKIFKRNPEIKKEFGDIVEEFTPRIEHSLMAGQTVLTKAELERIEAVLQALSEEGGPVLRASIQYVRQQLATPAFLQQYGITVID